MASAVWVVGFILLAASTASATAGCATEAFKSSCSKCPFTGPDIDEACKDSYQNKGKVCVSIAYPVAFGKYLMDSCPALQKCVDLLQSCGSSKCASNAKDNCASPTCLTCYTVADACAYRASMDCDEQEKCGNGDCNAAKGETRDTCCADCGCESGYSCKGGTCLDKTTMSPDDETADNIAFAMWLSGCVPFTAGVLGSSALLAAIFRVF